MPSDRTDLTCPQCGSAEQVETKDFLEQLSMGCTCTGYYKCNGCPSEIAQEAQDDAELLRDGLAGRWDPLDG